MKHSSEVEDAAILQVIRNEQISDQQGLVEKLKSLGFSIPQSTLSRRLKRLGVVKLHNIYKIIELEAAPRVSILSLKVSPPNLILLRTLPGHASSLAAQIDQKIPNNNSSSPSQNDYDSLLGTIAGDDTVLVIADGSKDGLEELKIKIQRDYQAKVV
jgi:transcriptional regulator of arginine metabolism